MSKSKKSLRTIPADTYRKDYHLLYQGCIAAQRQAVAEQKRLYRKMIAILEPWSDLQSFHEADAAILANLEMQAAMIQTHLGGRMSARPMPQLRTMAMAVALCLVSGLFWLSWQSKASPADAAILTVQQSAYRIWYQATYFLWTTNTLQISAVIVGIAVVLGLFTAMRTRSY